MEMKGFDQMNKRVETVALALLVLMAAATTTQATTYYSRTTGSTGSWASASSWNTARDGSGSPGVPGINDDAVIQGNHTIFVNTNSAAATTILIESGAFVPGLLEILNNGILTVKTSITCDDTAGVSGEFHFAATSGGAAILVADDGDDGTAAVVTLTGFFVMGSTGSGGTQLTQFDDDESDNDSFHLTTGSFLYPIGNGLVTVSAPFENDGSIDASVVTFMRPVVNDGDIEDGQFFAAVENNGTITGNAQFVDEVLNTNTGTITAGSGNAITFTSSASLENNGEVAAVSGGDIDFDSAPSAASTGLFKVTGSGSTIDFDYSGACTITGGADFEIGAGGLLNFNSDDMTTNGGIKIAGSSSFPGKVTAAPSITFEATGDF